MILERIQIAAHHLNIHVRTVHYCAVNDSRQKAAKFDIAENMCNGFLNYIRTILSITATL